MIHETHFSKPTNLFPARLLKTSRENTSTLSEADEIVGELLHQIISHPLSELAQVRAKCFHPIEEWDSSLLFLIVPRLALRQQEERTRDKKKNLKEEWMELWLMTIV
jgi:hypothetical protein